MDKDMLKLLMEMAGDSKTQLAKLIEFESEEQCIEHCIKLAKLRPGDVVYSDGKMKSVFVAWHVEKAKAFLMYHDEHKHIGLMSATPSSLTFEPVTE